MPSISRKYGENLFNPSKIMEQYKDVKSLEKLSANELDIMISTTEYEIQRVTSNQGLFLSTLAIVFALILVVVSGFANTALKIVFTTIYMFIMIGYYFYIVNNIKKNYNYLNELRFVRGNKHCGGTNDDKRNCL